MNLRPLLNLRRHLRPPLAWTHLEKVVLHGFALKGPVALALGAPTLLEPGHHHNGIDVLLPQHRPVEKRGGGWRLRAVPWARALRGGTRRNERGHAPKVGDGVGFRALRRNEALPRVVVARHKVGVDVLREAGGAGMTSE